MSDEDIIKLFYKCIVVEATTGRIDSFRYFNLPFNTIIQEGDIRVVHKVIKQSPFFDKDFLIPTLFINDISLFNTLLLEYVHKAILFYDDSNYYPEILSGELYDSHKMISREKYIICSLFANMAFEDFSNPYDFLEKRIQMIDYSILGTSEEIDFGYIELLKGRLIVEEIKEKMCNETPYSLRLHLHSDEFNEDFYFPDIRVGVCHDVSVIYAIQNEIENDKTSRYVKYVDRHVRKVDQGLNVLELEGLDLKNFTSSFLISALVGCLLCQNNNIEVIPLLIERWNAKQIANRIRASKMSNKEEFIEEKNVEQLRIQNNISDKFMRLFQRLGYQIEGFSCIFYDMKEYCTISSTLSTDNLLLQDVIHSIYDRVYTGKKMF